MSHDQKISDFTNQSGLIGTDLITIVRNGTNFNVTFAQLINSLGVTGTLTSIGSPTGTPVLNQPIAGVNQIRKFEANKGLQVSTSAQDGVLIGNDFINGSGGLDLIENLSADKTLFRNVSGGPGITIAIDGESIQIASAILPLSTKTVVIEKEADFPTAIAGVITLAPLTRYQLINSITTSSRFVLNDRTVVGGDGGNLSPLTYTGSGTMFTSVNSTVSFENLRIDCPAGKVFDATNPSTTDKAIIMDRVVVDNCDVIGNIADVFGVLWNNVRFSNVITNGLSFAGNNQFVLLESSFVNQLTGTLIDLGSSTTDGLSFVNSVVITSAAATLLSGLPNSGNINAGGIGTVINNRSIGSIGLVNISPDDALWQFLLNDTIPDTRPDGLLSMQGNATNTVITLEDTGVLVAGTFVIQETSQFTGTTGGRLIYNGGKDSKLPLTASVTIEPVSGGSQDMGIEVAINGVVIPDSLRVSSTASGSPITLDMHWQAVMTTNDFVEIFVSNRSVTTDVLVTSAILRVN